MRHANFSFSADGVSPLNSEAQLLGNQDMGGSRRTGEGRLRDALEAMQLALDLLDAEGAPAHIGAHLDLAICELKETLADPHHAPPAEPRPPLRP